MKITFISMVPYEFTPDTPYNEPLGGSESSMAYLAEALAYAGHTVDIFNRIKEPTVSRGVAIRPLEIPDLVANIRSKPDALVIQNYAGNGFHLQKMLHREQVACPLLLWCQHSYDQPAIQSLYNFAESRSYDGFVFLSDWQKEKFCERFALYGGRARVIHNAIAPAFEKMFDKPSSIVEAKSHTDPVFAYTSTPYRGLNVLLKVFTRIKKNLPKARLKVFSSMRVYGQENGAFNNLYKQCQETDGVEYRGSVSQVDLAKEMREVSVFAYPNTFAETYCISVIEAMASGAYVFTTDMGALRETTAGFAHLLRPIGEVKEQEYINTLVEFVTTRLYGKQLSYYLAAQVAYANEQTWTNRAKEWLDFIGEFKRAKS